MITYAEPVKTRAVFAAVVALVTLVVTACGAGGSRPAAVPNATHLPAAAAPVATTPAPTTTAPAATSTTATSTTATSTTVPANPCRANAGGQLVRVSISQQHLWMCAGHKLVRDTPVTTGIPGEDTHTPTGTYTIQARTRNTTLTLISGKTYAVQYWIPFDGPLFGFHDSSWQDFPYGSRRYRTDGSHGCVHMPVRAIAFLYRWVDVGATVRIR